MHTIMSESELVEAQREYEAQCDDAIDRLDGLSETDLRAMLVHMIRSGGVARQVVDIAERECRVGRYRGTRSNYELGYMAFHAPGSIVPPDPRWEGHLTMSCSGCGWVERSNRWIACPRCGCETSR